MNWQHIDQPDTLILEPVGGQTQIACIFLHGLGADGFDFANITNYLFLPLPTRFILPHAPKVCVRLCDNQHFRAWYDLGYNQTGSLDYNVDQLNSSAKRIVQLIKTQKALGIEKIILTGFSQGASLVLWLLAHFNDDISGYGVLSGYLLPALLEKRDSVSSRSVFVSHGTLDEVIPLEQYERICRYLYERHHQVTQFNYPNMGHTIGDVNFSDFGRWVAQLVQ